MKTAISIRDELFRAAEQAAKRLGISRSELYQRALAAFLKGISDPLVTEALDKVYGKEPRANRLDPFLEKLQGESLPREEW